LSYSLYPNSLLLLSQWNETNDKDDDDAMQDDDKDDDKDPLMTMMVKS